MQGTEQYSFDSVFDVDADQSSIFCSIVRPLIGDLFQSLNSLIFAYGITNSGKTFTMEGTSDEPGIVPRTLSCIFQNISHVYSRRNVCQFSNVIILVFICGILMFFIYVFFGHIDKTFQVCGSRVL